jgi:hypothetical protein
MQQRPEILTDGPSKMPARDQPQRNRVLLPHTCIQIRLLPGQPRWIQPQRICLAILPSKEPKIPSIKQPVRAFGSNNNTLGRLTHGMTQRGQLRSINDRQYNVGRLAEKDEFHQRRQGANPSNNLTGSCPPPRHKLPTWRNTRIQPMVQRSRQQRRRRPLPG